MARSRVQTDRSNISRNRPPSGVRDPGQLYVNWPDRQIGVIDAAQDPIDLVGVRFFSEDAAYIVDEWVIQAGRAYRCTVPTGPGAFVPASWQVIGEVFEAPLDGGIYGRQSSGWTATITKVVYDNFVLATNDHLSDIDTELTTLANDISFNAGNIASLNTLKAPLASPVFTGNPQAPTPATADNDTSVATTAYVQANLANYTTSATLVATYAPLASPVFTGNPTAPTPATADNDTSVATTAFVKAQGYLTDAPNDAFTYGRRGGAWTKAHDALGVSTWVFETATAVPPTAGCIRLNNATQNLATKIYISTTSATGALMERLLRFLFGVGTTFVISNNQSPGRWNTFVVTGVPVVASGYASIDVAFVAGSADVFNNALAYVEVSGGGGGASVHIGDTAPAGPLTPGQLWWESNSGNMFLYFDDGTSEQWVQVNVQGADAPVATALPRNRIVNPAMQINQEAPGIVTTHNTYFCDGWKSSFANSGLMRYERVPAGGAIRFLARLYTTTADAAIAAGDFATIYHPIEGRRVADFMWGTVNAKPAVLRFTAFTQNASGTYSAAVRSAIGDRAFVVNFTLVAGVYKEIVIPIPAITSGTWPTDSTESVTVAVTFACGATYQTPTPGVWANGNYLAAAGINNGIGVAGNDFYIGNVGLYLDPDATGVPPRWEMPDEAEELRVCQRYYEEPLVSPAGAFMPVALCSVTNATSARSGVLPFMTEKRVPPAVSVVGNVNFLTGGTVTNPVPAPHGTTGFIFTPSITGGTAGQCQLMRFDTAGGKISASARF